MATSRGGWSLNNKGVLEYRLLVDDSPTGAVLASISGLNLVAGTGDNAGKIVQRTGEGDNVTETVIDVGQKITVSGEYETVDEVEKATNQGLFTISSDVLGTSNISVISARGYAYTMALANATDKVHLDGEETITYDSTAGTATITGNLTAGFTLNSLEAGKATVATYNAAKTNQTLATVSGLQKGYTSTTAELTKTTRDETTGEITADGAVTLSKVAKTSSDVSALGTTVIKVAMDKVATANGINYYLALGAKTGEDYAQVAQNDEAAYWTVNKNTATYQYYSPTGYTLNTTDGKATQVNVTAAKTTVVATVTGLAADLTTNITDASITAAKANPTTASIADKVGTGQARTADGKTENFVSGITVTGSLTKPTTTTTDGVTTTTKGTVTINITKAALPLKGNLTVVSGANFDVTATTGSDFLTKENADAASPNIVKDQKIWVISGNTAVYKKVDLAYYELLSPTTDKKGNKVTTITCVPQTGGTVLTTIKGLNEDWLANEANLTRDSKDTTTGGGVITAIKGISVTDGTAAEYTGKTLTKAAVPGSITVAEEVLDQTNVSLGKNDNYRLVLQTADVMDGDTKVTSKVTLPTFDDYKWNLSGTTATLKGKINAGYTSSDDGKTILYTAAADNQTLATVSGLKKGTMLDKSETGDNRTIGNYINSAFTAGVVAGGNALTYSNKAMTTSTGESTSINVLNRIPITLSKHVLEGRVGLNSSFFTLAINKKDVDGTTTPATTVAKANSRTYVFEMDELYEDSGTKDKKGNTIYQAKSDAAAIVGWHGAVGATSVLKATTPAYYTPVEDAYGTVKTINYTASPKTQTTLATIRGLNSAINEDDISFDISTGLITIRNANALTTGNVTLTNGSTDTTVQPTQYKLALANGVSGLGEATLSNQKWTQNGTTVTFSALVTQDGYKVNADQNTITYTKAATNNNATTFATITGLRTDLTKVAPSTTSSSGNTPGNTPETDETSWEFAGVDFNNAAGTITLSKTALNNSTVTLNGAGNYKLQIDNTIPTTTTANQDRWVVSGTNAVFKKINTAYYDLSGNTLAYRPAVDVTYTADEATAKGNAKLKGKSIVYGTIRGLASGLVASDDGQKIGYYDSTSGDFVEAIEFGTGDDAKKIIITDTGVLDNKNSVSLDATAIAEGYTIALADSLVDAARPHLEGEASWSVNRGTATYKGNITAGYANSSDGYSINFSKAANNATIATIAGLDTTLTTDSLNALITSKTGLQFVASDDDSDSDSDTTENVIKVYSDVLGTSATTKLTTSVAILGKNYELALDSDVPTSTGVESEKHDGWTISGTKTSSTATYGTFTPKHYDLNADKDTITYTAYGMGDNDKLATITGLAAGLVTIQDEQIRGITLGSLSGTTFTADDEDTTTPGTVFQLSSDVLPTAIGSEIALTNADGKSYALTLDASDSSIPTPEETTAYEIKNAKVTITQAFKAGYAYGKNGNAEDKTKLKYYSEESTGDGFIGTITGLNPNIKNNASGGIDGITIDNTASVRTITISSTDVLTNGDVTLSSGTFTTGNPKYTFVLDSTKISAPSSGTALKAGSTKGTFELRDGTTTEGYSLEDSGARIKFTNGGDGGEAIATITGLKNIDASNVVVDNDNYTITISSGALNSQNVEIEMAEGYKGTAYTLALNNVDSSSTTAAWALANGVATYTQTTTAGYAVSDGNIVYTPASTITSTLNNLSKEKLFISSDGTKLVTKTGDIENDAITFTAGDAGTNTGTFTVLDSDALAHKGVVLNVRTSSKNVTADYVFELDDDIEAKVEEPVWNKSTASKAATLTQTTASGYSLSANKKNITYSSDPITVTFATVGGLNADVALNQSGRIETTDETTGTTTTTAGLAYELPTDSESGKITISKDVLTNSNVTLGKNDNYVFVLDTTAATKVPVSTDVSTTQAWTVNKTTATYKNVTPAHYALATNAKAVNYVAQADYKGADGTASPNLVTISGLKNGLVPNADGSITGISVNDKTKAITLKSNVLGTTPISVPKDSGYTIALDSTETTSGDIITYGSDYWEDQTEWVDSGKGNYALKKYNKAYYNPVITGDNANILINYQAPTAGTAYATISGLKTGLDLNASGIFTASDSDLSKGGTIKLNNDMLNNANVAIKVSNGGGEFSLALNNDVTESEISDKKWTTNKTTSTLTGTKTAGYTLSSDAQSITYQRANGTVTLATIKGIKSGAEISDIQNGTITLSKSQLGTSNVTIAGDGYTLAVGEDAQAQVENAKWIKANATTATYTQKTYNGFKASADGKTLTYQRNTSDVNLVTISGLNKDITTDDMGTGSDSKAVVINETNKTVTLKRAALTNSNVALGRYDEYKLVLDETEATSGAFTAGQDVDAHWTFNNGTASYVGGKSQGWAVTNDKLITYTAATGTPEFTITGLSRNLTFTEDTSDATKNKVEGISISGTTITVNSDALAGMGKAIALTNTGDTEYTLALDTSTTGKTVTDLSTDALVTKETKQKWAIGKKNVLMLNEVVPAGYKITESTNKAKQKVYTITPSAEKVTKTLATITGIPFGLKVSDDGTKVYLSDGSTPAIDHTTNSSTKTIDLQAELTNAIQNAGTAATLSLTSANGYTFSTTGGSVGNLPTPSLVGADFDINTSFTTATKATIQEGTSAGWTKEANKFTYAPEATKIVATLNGIKKDFDPATNRTAVSLASDSTTATISAAALTTSNVTVSLPKGATTVYNLALGSGINTEANKDSWTNQTEWVVSGGTASYKTYDQANYKLQDGKTGQPNSIIYVAPTKGTQYAAITGLNKNATSVTQATEDSNGDIIISLGKDELTTSRVVLNNAGAKTAGYPRNVTEEQKAAIDAQNAVITDHNNTAAKFKLALKDDVQDSLSTVENAVWDNNGTVANLTGTITKGYKLSNDQKSITYQAADSRLQVIAKVSGIKSGAEISDINVSALSSSDDNYNAALPNLQYITLTEDHLGNSNVQLTGEGYKLALDSDVITDADTDKWQNKTDWVAANGTFTYQTYDKKHYKLNDAGNYVTYTADKCDTKNNGDNHKIHAQISGLSRTAESSAVTAPSYSGDNAISLTSTLLNKSNVVLADKDGGGYTLDISNIDSSLKSTVSNFNASVTGSGAKLGATWVGTQGKGYLLSNDSQAVTYYSADRAKQTVAAVTGLNTSITSANNDAFSGKYNASTNTVTLGKDDLSSNVVISGTAAFSIGGAGYEDALITGSKAADKIAVTGSNISVNAGAGNDVVDFTGATGSTFLYANNTGNDVIKGLGSNSIKITNVAATTTDKKGNTVNNITVAQDDKITADTLVKVNNTTLRLKGVTASSASVYDSTGKLWNGTTFAEVASGSDNVLADDDYAMSPNLSSIVKGATSSYAAEDLATDDATSLAKQSTAVSYSGKK